MEIIKRAAYILVIIGAFNWGLIGAFHFDLVAYLFGDMSRISRAVYLVIGLCAIFTSVFIIRKNLIEDLRCGS